MAKKSEEMEPSLDYEQLFSIQPELTPTGLLPLDTVLGGGYEPGDVIAITSEPGVGKALSMDATLYTESGPIQMKDVKVGDKIADPSGNFVEVVGVYPQGLQKMYLVRFEDGTEVRCSGDHLWAVEKWSGSYGECTLTTEDMMDTVFVGSSNNCLRRNYAIKLNKAVMFSKKELTLPPYLLGVILGCGFFRRNTPILIDPKHDVLSRIEKLIHSIGGKLSELPSKKSSERRFSITGISKKVKNLGLTNTCSSNLFIPIDYKYSDVKDRIDLILGLTDTCGSKRSEITFQFVTTSKKLESDIKELTSSLGLKSFLCGTKKYHKCPHTPRGFKRCYAASFMLSSDTITEEAIANQSVRYVYIDEIKEIGYEECQCIRVDNESHLFLTNGFIPTHNTTMFLTLAKNFIQQGHRVAYFDVEKGIKIGILKNFGLADVTGCDIAKSPFFLIKPDTYTTMEKAFRDCVNFGIKYIFIDSMTALVDSTYIDELVSDKVTIGSSARVETQLYPVLKGLAKMNEVTVFIVQQMRIKMESKGMRMNVSKDSGGGYAAKHTPDVRLFLDKGPKYVEERVGLNGEKEKVEYGNEARLYAEKNRNAPPFVKVPCPIIYGHGMKNSLYVDLILRSHGAIRSGGPYYKIALYPDKDPVSVQGKSNLAKWISENLDECIKVIKENGWSEIKSVQVD